MQRRFSTFPDGWPGVGLLLLRASASAAALAKGVALLGAPGEGAWAITLGLAALVGGGALLAGFFTPVAGVATAWVGLLALLAWPSVGARGIPSIPADAFLVVLAGALVLLGPGALSVDARLFGRREIVVPRVSRPPDEVAGPASTGGEER